MRGQSVHSFTSRREFTFRPVETIFSSPKSHLSEQPVELGGGCPSNCQYYENEKKLILQGAVRVEHPRDAEILTTLTTDQLTLFTDTDRSPLRNRLELLTATTHLLQPAGMPGSMSDASSYNPG